MKFDSQLLSLRRKKSMVVDAEDPNRRSAGSFFLNPVVSAAEAEAIAEQAVCENLVTSPESVPHYPTPTGRVEPAAGWLVEKAGFEKGTRRGRLACRCDMHSPWYTTVEERARSRSRFADGY